MQRVKCHSQLPLMTLTSFSRSFFSLSLSQQTPPLPPPLISLAHSLALHQQQGEQRGIRKT